MTLLFLYFLIFQIGMYYLGYIFINRIDRRFKFSFAGFDGDEVLLCVAPAITYALIATSALICNCLELPPYLAFMPSLLVALPFSKTDCFQIYHDVASSRWKVFAAFTLISAIFLILNVQYMYIDNVSRGTDPTAYYLSSLYYFNGSKEIFTFKLYPDWIVSRPPLHTMFMSPFYQLWNSEMWVFQLLMTCQNCFFIPAFWILLKRFFDEKLANLCVFITFCNPVQAFYITFYFNKHQAHYIVIMSLIFLLCAEKNKCRANLVLSGALLSIGFFTHQSALFYAPIALYVLYCRNLLNIKNLRISALAAFVAGLPVLAYRVYNFGLLNGLFKSPTNDITVARSVSEHLAIWATNFGSSFTPAYLVYSTFFNQDVSAGLGRILNHLLVFPCHLTDVWYLAADILGAVFIMYLLGSFISRNHKAGSSPSAIYRIFKIRILRLWENDLVFALSMINFVVISIGTLAVPVWIYGANHNIGLLAMTLINGWVICQLLVRIRSRMVLNLIVTWSIFETFVYSWLSVIVVQFAYLNKGIYPLVFKSIIAPTYETETILRSKYTYLYDLMPLGSVRVLWGAGIIMILILGYSLSRGYQLVHNGESFIRRDR